MAVGSAVTGSVSPQTSKRSRVFDGSRNQRFSANSNTGNTNSGTDASSDVERSRLVLKAKGTIRGSLQHQCRFTENVEGVKAHFIDRMHACTEAKQCGYCPVLLSAASCMKRGPASELGVFECLVRISTLLQQACEVLHPPVKRGLEDVPHLSSWCRAGGFTASSWQRNSSVRLRPPT